MRIFIMLNNKRVSETDPYATFQINDIVNFENKQYTVVNKIKKLIKSGNNCDIEEEIYLE